MGKNVFRTKAFSLILPEGWIVDHKGEVLALYPKAKDAGVVQISTFSSEKPMKNSEINPKTRLENHIKKQTKDKVKIKVQERMRSISAISDFYKLLENREERCWKMMVTMTKNRMAFVTYNIEWEFRNARLKDIEEIFDSFLLES